MLWFGFWAGKDDFTWGRGIEDRFKVNNYKISLSTKNYYIFGQRTAQITAKHAESLVDGEINFFLCEN